MVPVKMAQELWGDPVVNLHPAVFPGGKTASVHLDIGFICSRRVWSKRPFIMSILADVFISFKPHKPVGWEMDADFIH